MNSTSSIIQMVFRLFTLVIIVDVFLSFFLPPGNRLRIALDQVVTPFLNPIRKFIPTVGNIDFSPVILILIIQTLEYIILRFI